MTKITNNEIRESFGLEPLKDKFMKFNDMVISNLWLDTPGIGDEFFEIYLGDLDSRTRVRYNSMVWDQIEVTSIPPSSLTYDTPIDWEFV